MESIIILNSTPIPYTLVVSDRAKRIRLAVYAGGILKVTIPKRVPKFTAEKFIQTKAEWIIRTIEKLQLHSITSNVVTSRKEYLAYKEKAWVLVIQKLEKFNAFYGFVYTGVSIKNQKTLWGSCSRRGRLNFNYKLALLPDHLADYVVVHELCHLKEFNHGEKFWKLVEKVIPNYKECVNELKKTGLHFN